MFRKVMVSCGISSLLAISLYAQDDWSMNNCFSVFGEFVYMRRTEAHNHSIVDSTTRTRPELDTKKLGHEFDFEPGYRVGVSYIRDRKASFEANYMWISEWESHNTVRGHGTLFYPFNNASYTNNFQKADKAKARYISHFQTAEVNYWDILTPRRENFFSVSGILGLRFLRIREEFKLRFTRSEMTSDYDTHTKNSMWGGQIGGNLQWNPTRRWSWDATVKFGALINYVTSKTFLGDFNNTVVLRDFKHSRHVCAFLGEGAVSLTCQVGCHFNLHAGYQVIYLTELTLAPDQLSKKTTPNSGKYVYARGQAFIHGVFTGLTFSF